MQRLEPRATEAEGVVVVGVRRGNMSVDSHHGYFSQLHPNLNKGKFILQLPVASLFYDRN